MEIRPKGQSVRDFFEIETRSIIERYKTIEKILPSKLQKGSAHPAEEGRFVESLIRDFLNKHLPFNLKAMSGFIIKPSTKTGLSNLERVNNEIDTHSKQIDILVYDVATFPIYEKFEEFCIVPPEGVIAALSIKKNLRMSDIIPEIQSLREVYNLCNAEKRKNPYLGLLAFTSEFDATELICNNIFKKLKEEYDNTPSDSMINELIVLDSFMLFKFRKESSDKKSMNKYVKIDLVNKSNIALQRLLQSIMGVYYYKNPDSNIERPGFVSFEKGTFGDAPLAGYIKYAE